MVQKMVQQFAANEGNAQQTKTATPVSPRALPLVSAPFGALLEYSVGDEGLEPPTSTL